MHASEKPGASHQQNGLKTYTLLGPDRRPNQSYSRGTLGGYRRRHIYGRLDCLSALRAIAKGGYVAQRVFFADEKTALAAGYRPCAVCLPEKYAQWKAERTTSGLSEAPESGNCETP